MKLSSRVPFAVGFFAIFAKNGTQTYFFLNLFFESKV
jgi:hypothetical protein